MSSLKQRKCTAFYYAAGDWPESHVTNDINKLISQKLTHSSDRYVVLISHRSRITAINITSTGVNAIDVTHEVPGSNMALPEAFRWFLTNLIGDVHSVHSIFFSCHAQGYELQLGDTEKDMLPISDIAFIMEEKQLVVQNIFLDACCCSNLDVLYTLRNVTKTVVAYETYCPWEGLLSSCSLICPDPIDLVKQSMDRYESRERYADEQPSDICVLSTRFAQKLAENIWMHLQPTEEDFQDQLAQPEYPFLEGVMNPLYDVRELLLTLSQKYQRLRMTKQLAIAKTSIKLLDEKTILYYTKSSDNPLKTHGLATFVHPKMMLPKLSPSVAGFKLLTSRIIL